MAIGQWAMGYVMECEEEGCFLVPHMPLLVAVDLFFWLLWVSSASFRAYVTPAPASRQN